jgi:hypothetical protein
MSRAPGLRSVNVANVALALFVPARIVAPFSSINGAYGPLRTIVGSLKVEL